MKLLLFFLVVLVLLLYLIIPKTKWASLLNFSERIFFLINFLGVIFGALGLVLTFLFPKQIMDNHIYELILFPVFIAYIYVAILAKIKGIENIYDEKQIYDMNRAAATTIPFSVFFMFLIYAFLKENDLHSLVWFPAYIFTTITVYSSSTLYYFKKS